jgi:hypothetical protein
MRANRRSDLQGGSSAPSPATSPECRYYVRVTEEIDGTTSSKGNGGVICGIVLSYDCFHRPETWRKLTYCIVGHQKSGRRGWRGTSRRQSLDQYLIRTILANLRADYPGQRERENLRKRKPAPAYRHFIFSLTKPCSRRADTRRARLPKARERTPGLYIRNSPRRTEPRADRS